MQHLSFLMARKCKRKEEVVDDEVKGQSSSCRQTKSGKGQTSSFRQGYEKLKD